MITRDAATRIAVATNALRPTWSEASIMAILGDERIRLRRTEPDTAAALAWLALDPGTQKPTRLFESGVWWGTADLTAQNSGPAFRYPNPRDCGTCSKPEPDCRCGSDYVPAYVHRDDRATPDQIAAVKQAAVENAKPLPTIKPDTDTTTTKENAS